MLKRYNHLLPSNNRESAKGNCKHAIFDVDFDSKYYTDHQIFYTTLFDQKNLIIHQAVHHTKKTPLKSCMIVPFASFCVTMKNDL